MAKESKIDRQIREKYPQYAFLLGHKEIGPLLRKHRKSTSEKFRAALVKTKWWKSTAESKRMWLLMKSDDPRSARNKKDQRRGIIGDLAYQAGLRMSSKQIAALAESSLANGWDENQINDAIYGKMQFKQTAEGGAKGSKAIQSGTLTATMGQMRELGSQYMVDLDDQTAFTLARDLLTGRRDGEATEQYMHHLAINRFPELEEFIKKGIRPKQYFQPIQQNIAKELEIGEDAVDLTDSKYSPVLQHVDENGNRRAMTLSESTTFARKQEEWKNTRGAQEQAAGLADQLAQTFGAIKR